MESNENINNCPVEDVAAYLDGELSETAQARFEDHLKSCAACAAELRAQRQLLCTLDVAFNGSRAFSLPQDFSRIVTTRAENDLSGMRHRHERRRALKMCAILALVSFALLGAATRTIVWDPLRSLVKVTGSLLQLIWQATSEAASGAGVVIRMIGRAILFSQNGAGRFVFLAFLLSISLLSFLIAKYHRAQIVE